jgi:hypothetical protein
MMDAPSGENCGAAAPSPRPTPRSVWVVGFSFVTCEVSPVARSSTKMLKRSSSQPDVYAMAAPSGDQSIGANAPILLRQSLGILIQTKEVGDMPVRNRSARIRRANSKRTQRQVVIQKRGKDERREDRSRRLWVRDIPEDQWDWLWVQVSDDGGNRVWRVSYKK